MWIRLFAKLPGFLGDFASPCEIWTTSRKKPKSLELHPRSIDSDRGSSKDIERTFRSRWEELETLKIDSNLSALESEHTDTPCEKA